MTYSDFINWRSDPVTKAFFEAANQRVEDTKEILSTSAGIDKEQDTFYRGFIHAYREMQDFHMEDVE